MIQYYYIDRKNSSPILTQDSEYTPVDTITNCVINDLIEFGFNFFRISYSTYDDIDAVSAYSDNDIVMITVGDNDIIYYHKYLYENIIAEFTISLTDYVGANHLRDLFLSVHA